MSFLQDFLKNEMTITLSLSFSQVLHTFKKFQLQQINLDNTEITSTAKLGSAKARLASTENIANSALKLGLVQSFTKIILVIL